jgi:hypothetical protein
MPYPASKWTFRPSQRNSWASQVVTSCLEVVPLAAGFCRTGIRKPGRLTLAAYRCIVHWWHPSKNGSNKPGLGILSMAAASGSGCSVMAAQRAERCTSGIVGPAP